MNEPEYDEDEIERLQAIEEKYNAINERINRKIGHGDLYDDLDEHNNRVRMMEDAIAHPIRNIVSSAGLGAVIGSVGGALIGKKPHPSLVLGAGLGMGGLMGVGARAYRNRAIREIDDVRRKRDAFKAEWDKLGA